MQKATTSSAWGGMRQGLLSLWLFRFLGLTLLASALGLAGCDQSDNDDDSGNGEVVIGLTDAEGDFSSYTVDVHSLTLTKANGAVVETLPLSTRVDFAQYTELTEFLTAATVPSGLYTRATLELDYSNADIFVENAAGDSVKVEQILDENGSSLSTLEVSVVLEGQNALLIAPGLPAHITLDFDLNASNHVEFDDQGIPTQTVSPVLLADVELERPKTHRLRGPLKSVNPDTGEFQVIIRPFIHLMSLRDERFGSLTVATDNTTLYDINNESYQGAEGLRVLDGLPTFTATLVLGDLKFNPRRFEAREVYAGSSVPGGELDVVTGNIIARSGNAFTVKGATLIRAGGSVIFNDEVVLQVGEATRVKRQLSMDDFEIGDLSVGQRITVFGTLVDDTPPRLELDANNGQVHMLLTTLHGSVKEVSAGLEQTLALDLQSVDLRRVALFDFTGTGADPASDADPENYQVDPAGLDLSSLAPSAPIKVRGFVRPFGQAPQDFEAQTLVNLTEIPAVLVTNWNPATAQSFQDLSSEGLTLNLTGTGFFHHVNRGGVVTDLSQLDQAASIKPKASGEGVFFITGGGSAQLFTRWDDFVGGLESRLAAGGLVKSTSAAGTFDDASATLTARSCTVRMR